MGILADRIERFILEKILEEQEEITIFRRNELADELECAPSQISYVLSTRFSPDRGYEVESRRGLGGYIRITRLETPESVQVRITSDRESEKNQINTNLPVMTPLDLGEVDRILYHYLKTGNITQREAQILHESFRIVIQYVTPKKRDDAVYALYRSLMDLVKE